MWSSTATSTRPLLDQPEAFPYHSRQLGKPPRVYIQDLSIEMAGAAVDVHDSIAGEKVAPFLTEEPEGFSIDYPDDWRYAEEMIAASRATCPRSRPRADDGARPAIAE